jgi:hypothetical protein
VAVAAGRLSTHRLKIRPDFDPDETADLSGYPLATYPVVPLVWEGAAA